MVKVFFSLQDAPDFYTSANMQYAIGGGEISVSHEQALAILINEMFPNLRSCNRRIKHLIVIDENGKEYETKDFDIYGSLKKKDDKNETD